MNPGSTRMTSIPQGASSCRNVSLTAAIADFEDASAPKNGIVIRSTIEPMNTMRPSARRRSGISGWVNATWPKKSTSNDARNESSGIVSSGPGIPIPAMLASASSPATPTCSSIRSTVLAMSSALVMSRWTLVRVSSSATDPAAAGSVDRSPANTWNPAATAASIVALPMPEDVPVTMMCVRSQAMGLPSIRPT